MSDPAKRAICRLAFVLVCVLPTVAVGYQIVRIVGGNDLPSLELQLQNQIGSRARIERLELPQPGVQRLSSVCIFPGRNHELLGTDYESTEPVSWRLPKVVHSVRSGQVRLAAVSEPVRLSTVVQILQRAVERLDRQVTTPIRMTLDQAEVLNGSGQRAILYDLKLGTFKQNGGTVGEIEFKTQPEADHGVAIRFIQGGDIGDHSGTDDGQPANLPSTSEPPFTVWTLDCPSTPVALTMLEEILPIAKSLGADTTFQGSAVWTVRSDGSLGKCEINGHLNRIDLERFVSRPLGQPCHGLASVSHLYCRLEGEQIVDLSGQLSCDQATWGQHFVNAFSQCRLNVKSEEPLQVVHQLQLSFRIKDRALQISAAGRQPIGLDANGQPSVDFVGQYRAIKMPIEVALQIFIPGPKSEVPLSAASVELMRRMF